MAVPLIRPCLKCSSYCGPMSSRLCNPALCFPLRSLPACCHLSVCRYRHHCYLCRYLRACSYFPACTRRSAQGTFLWPTLRRNRLRSPLAQLCASSVWTTRRSHSFRRSLTRPRATRRLARCAFARSALLPTPTRWCHRRHLCATRRRRSCGRALSCAYAAPCSSRVGAGAPCPTIPSACCARAI
jgi:hypothetical protein